MKVLVVGDTVGRPGRKAIKELYPQIKEEYGIDFFILNGENLSGGSGVNARCAEEMFDAQVDVMTNGDHAWDQKEAKILFNTDPRMIRPANYPEPCMGKGFTVITTDKGIKIAVLNLLGRVFLKTVDCPFKKADELLESLPKDCKIVIVDMHAEATSEKIAMGWYLDGRVSAVFGTHTHIQTADERLLPKGTGYLTDVGMTGAYDSVIGRKVEPVIDRFLNQLPVRLEVADGNVKLCGVIFDIDEKTGQTTTVERIQKNLI